MIRTRAAASRELSRRYYSSEEGENGADFHTNFHLADALEHARGEQSHFPALIRRIFTSCDAAGHSFVGYATCEYLKRFG